MCILQTRGSRLCSASKLDQTPCTCRRSKKRGNAVPIKSKMSLGRRSTAVLQTRQVVCACTVCRSLPGQGVFRPYRRDKTAVVLVYCRANHPQPSVEGIVGQDFFTAVIYVFVGRRSTVGWTRQGIPGRSTLPAPS